MKKQRVGIIGASGYSGIEATRLLWAHPQVELAFLTSDRWKGDSVGARVGITGSLGKLSYIANDEGIAQADGCAAVFLCTPAETSHELAPKLVDKTRVVDFSGAFRLREASQYPAFYNYQHRHPELLKTAVYGLPELGREAIRTARLIANPGCYATAAALTAMPLLKSGLLEEGSLIFDSASGVSGAGRQASEAFSFNEVDEDFRAYKVLRHQHNPEIHQTLEMAAGRKVSMTFTPHLLPVRRGILTTLYAKAAPGVSSAKLLEAYRAKYQGESFITVLDSPDEVMLRSVVGTNQLAVSVASAPEGFDPGRVVAISALDNLVKGAAGQAIQNLNLMMGWEEGLGLTTLRGFYP